MKKKSLRILSLIVAIVMVVAMLPLSALAEETKPTRKVGVVVYGSEFTQLLASAEKLSLQDFIDTVTEISTKVVNGEGVYVPEVDISIKGEDGKKVALKETDQVNVLTQTLQVSLPFDVVMNDLKNRIEADIEKMKEEAAKSSITKFAADKAEEVIGNLLGASDQATDLFNQIMGNLGTLTKLNPTLYRTYVTEEAVPEGSYTVRVEGFFDTDENGNAVTREGYVILNDGLTEVGSDARPTKEFTVDIIGLDENEVTPYNEIQFVGPAKGITGTIPEVDLLKPLYDTTKENLNKLESVRAELQQKFANLIASIPFGSNIEAWMTEKIPGYGFLKDWTVPQITAELSSDYTIGFPGLWCVELEAGFAFTDVDVAETGIAGSEYLLVNRDELIDVLKFMKELGKDAFQGALAATFGGTATYADGTVKDYDSIVNLYFELVKSEDGQLSLDYDTAFAILKTYLGVISDMNLFDRVVDTDTGDVLTPIKLKYPLPAFLQATSDENGIVKFNRDSNVTLTWMLQIIPQITEALKGTSYVEENKVVNLLVQVADYSADLIDTYGSKIINTLVYPFAQRLGLVGKKMASGNYIMFQTKAAEGYWINPFAYTMILTWENETWLYVTVADLGLIKPYFAAGFYDFVRDTTFAGTIDKFINSIAGKDVNIITGILDPEGIDITKEMGKVVTGALTAFVGQIGFESLGLDTIFSTKSEFVAGLNKYLYENGRTAQNLMIYVNKQAMRAKSVYAGYVTEDWYFYNIDKSPTTTATKLIDKSTKDIAAAFVNPTKSEIITKTGNTVKSIVGSIGYKVEEVAQNIRTQIKSTIGAAVQSVVQKAFDSVKTSVTNFVKDMFSRLING